MYLFIEVVAPVIPFTIILCSQICGWIFKDEANSSEIKLQNEPESKIELHWIKDEDWFNSELVKNLGEIYEVKSKNDEGNFDLLLTIFWRVVKL